MYYSLPATNVIYLIIHCAHPVAIAAPMPKKLMKAAKKRNPPWPGPNRGKARSLIKAFPMKRKMPKVAYVRDQKAVMKVDKRKMRWSRPVHMLAGLQGRSLLRLLRLMGCCRNGKASLVLDVAKALWVTFILTRNNKYGSIAAGGKDAKSVFDRMTIIPFSLWVLVPKIPHCRYKLPSFAVRILVFQYPLCRCCLTFTQSQWKESIHQPGSSAVQICSVDGKEDRLRSGQEMVRC